VRRLSVVSVHSLFFYSPLLTPPLVFELALDPSRPDDSVLNRADVENDVDALYHTGRGGTGKEKVYFLRLISYDVRPK